jgi:DNA polymerase-3 subunit delta
MIYFLYGAETFRSWQKLNQIRAKFSDSSLGNTNISIFEGKTLDFQKLDQAVQSLPFLARKKLVIVKNIFSEGPKSILKFLTDYLEKVPKTTHLIFFEQGKVTNKRLSLFKKLIKVAKSKEFVPLTPLAVKDWIKKRVLKLGGTIEPFAVEKLLLATGGDLWRLDNEINKLINFNKNIIAENVDQLVHAQVTWDIFSLIDAIGQKDLPRSIKMLQGLLSLGEDEIYIHSMIIFQIRNLLQVKNLQDKGLGSAEIIKRTSLHPFIVQKSLQQGQNFTYPSLKKLYRKLLDADFSIKTGRTEAKLTLDLLLVGLCQ